jgi:hypothetical protein
MNKKLQREMYGPGWIEVIFGAILSLSLGIVLAFLFLTFSPVVKVKELPKEPAANTVYFIPGSRNSDKTRQLSAKQSAFLQGQSVNFNEDELNALAAPKEAPKPTSLPVPANDKFLSASALDFRIQDSVMQIGLPLHLSAMGFEHDLIVQARGGFEKTGETVVFHPKELYIGGCPLQNLPGGVADKLFARMVASANMPAEFTEAWRRVTEAKVDGALVRLTMQ